MKHHNQQIQFMVGREQHSDSIHGLRSFVQYSQYLTYTYGKDFLDILIWKIKSQTFSIFL